MKRPLALLTLLSLGTLSLVAQTESFDHVKIHCHRSARDRVLVDRKGVLTFDDTNRRLTFLGTVSDRFDVQEKFDVGYDSVTKVVFEVTTHMRGGGIEQAMMAAFPTAVAGTILAGQHVHDYWFYFEYKTGDQDERVLLEVPKDSSEKVIEKANGLFSNRVTIRPFQEEGEEIDPEKLAAYKSKQALKIDKKDRPLPEIKADKATIVVVCPPLAARDTGKGNQFKLHANDQVVAINKAGTYSFAYLDPGKYRLVSQSENANGFEIELDAGKTYYFLQNTFQGVLRWKTVLSRNSPELVKYLWDGTYYSNWKPK